MDDDVWMLAQTKAEAAERKPGMTPKRRGLAKLFVEPLAAVIAARLADKKRLPHGRLGTLLQEAEPRELAIIALEAIASQLWRRRRKSDAPRDTKLAIGDVFYANVTLAKAAKDARGNKESLRTLRWRRFALAGKLKVGRHESPAAWLSRLRRTRFAIWRALTEETSREQRLRAGGWLLRCALDADIVRFVGSDLVPTERWEDDIRRLWDVVLRSNVQLLPFKEKPEPWTTQPEIYRDGLKVRFLSHWNRAHQASIRASFRTTRFRGRHLATVNRLQDVPLRVDDWTLSLVNSFAVDAKKAHQDPAYIERIRREVKTAAMVMRRGVFHNSHHIDWRGRLNADQSFNYATADTVRSLFRFAHGAEIGGNGLDWLRVHVANCYGVDKLPYSARIAWTVEHQDEIERVFIDPYGTTDFWYGASKQFAFAAACRELVLADDNPKYTTTLPIGFDHTASGIQHLALIGLDEKTAPLVNLINCATPRDVYGALAARTLKLFDNSASASHWRFVFNKLKGEVRKLLKTPGMTFAYASTDRGNVRQIYDELYDIFEPDDCPVSFEEVTYLVGRFRKACAQMLPGPAETMEYIQSLVRACNDAGRFLEWTTPSGLRVVNLYPKLDKPTIYLPDGSSHILAEIIPNSIRGGKAINSAAANYVHSYDASHLSRTVNALADNHMDVLCVHDCFAVLAPHAEQFHITNREELALMYDEIFQQGGPLALLRKQNGNIGDPPPPGGKFDYWKVQAATYACN